ncbi:mind kinetochore complex component [Ophiostoma piceae UAMH 11346]|uniref:Mind kinetochore complex component n=1 Tax=Ophiostoma piceae (strain UAMH 11346) TaxID=1262450 RepID=S3CAU2_OPHP1|nr:mind kinetochore complex component [Ophiostoma piceae UAMH 11346]
MATTDATAASSDVDMTATSATTQTAAKGDDEAMADAPPSEQIGAGDASQPEKSAPPPPPPAGPRAGRLQDLFRSSLQHTLTKISWENFAACYPTAAARNPVTLQAVHRAMVERLRELCASEFAVVLRNRDVVRRLNELEVLAADARKRREEASSSGAATPLVRPPHTLPSETVLAAHLKPQRRAQRQVLEERLAAVQAENAAKFAQLAVQQAEAEQLVAALERALGDAAGAAALLDGNDGAEEGDKGKSRGAANSVPLLTELARETRIAEAEMSGNA